jgi:hypothetical protein
MALLRDHKQSEHGWKIEGMKGQLYIMRKRTYAYGKNKT